MAFIEQGQPGNDGQVGLGQQKKGRETKGAEITPCRVNVTAKLSVQWPWSLLTMSTSTQVFIVKSPSHHKYVTSHEMLQEQRCGSITSDGLVPSAIRRRHVLPGPLRLLFDSLSVLVGTAGLSIDNLNGGHVSKHLTGRSRRRSRVPGSLRKTRDFSVQHGTRLTAFEHTHLCAVPA